MKSSGKLNFIKSNTLSIAIQKYYSLFLEVIKQEELFIMAVQKYSEREIPKLIISSFIEPLLLERWNGSSAPPNMSFLKNPEFNKLKPQLVNYFSVKEIN